MGEGMPEVKNMQISMTSVKTRDTAVAYDPYETRTWIETNDQKMVEDTVDCLKVRA